MRFQATFQSFKHFPMSFEAHMSCTVMVKPFGAPAPDVERSWLHGTQTVKQNDCERNAKSQDQQGLLTSWDHPRLMAMRMKWSRLQSFSVDWRGNDLEPRFREGVLRLRHTNWQAADCWVRLVSWEHCFGLLLETPTRIATWAAGFYVSMSCIIIYMLLASNSRVLSKPGRHYRPE